MYSSLAIVALSAPPPGVNELCVCVCVLPKSLVESHLLVVRDVSKLDYKV